MPARKLGDADAAVGTGCCGDAGWRACPRPLTPAEKALCLPPANEAANFGDAYVDVLADHACVEYQGAKQLGLDAVCAVVGCVGLRERIGDLKRGRNQLAQRQQRRMSPRDFIKCRTYEVICAARC